MSFCKVQEMEILDLHADCWVYFKSNAMPMSYVPHCFSWGNNPMRKTVTRYTELCSRSAQL